MGADNFEPEFKRIVRIPPDEYANFLNKIKEEAKKRTNSMEEYGDYITDALSEFERRYKENKYNKHEEDKVDATSYFKEAMDIMDKLTNDNVNHPNHYVVGKYECMDIMKEIFGEEAFKNYCYLNAFKYIWRSPRKNGTEDLKKAIFYLNKYIELSEK